MFLLQGLLLFTHCEMEITPRLMWLIAYVIFAGVAMICALVFWFRDKPFGIRSSEKRIESLKKKKADKEAEEAAKK